MNTHKYIGGTTLHDVENVTAEQIKIKNGYCLTVKVYLKNGSMLETKLFSENRLEITSEQLTPHSRVRGGYLVLTDRGHRQ